MPDPATVSVERRQGLVWLHWRDKDGVQHAIPFRPEAARELGIALIEEARNMKGSH